MKKLKSVESMLEGESTIASLTGRPGMSIRSKEGMAKARVKLGRNLSSNGVKGSDFAYKVTFVRLG